MHVPATSHSFTWWSDNNGSWFVYLILWVLEIDLRSSGWAASAFTLWAILPSHCWASNMTLPMKIVITTAVLQHYWKKKKDTIFLRRISSNSSSSGSRLNHCSSVPSDSGCLEYRVNLELVLCPCLKKDCLDLEEWRVLESTKEQSRCDTQTDCQRLIQATFHFSSSSLQALANLKKKLTGHTEEKKISPRVWAWCFAVLATYSLWRSLGGDGAWGSSRGITHHHWATGQAPISVRHFPEPSKEDKGSKTASHPTSK